MRVEQAAPAAKHAVRMHIHHQQQLLLDATTTFDGCSSCQQLQHQQHKEKCQQLQQQQHTRCCQLKNSQLDKQLQRMHGTLLVGVPRMQDNI
jgi:hypothetical protein